MLTGSIEMACVILKHLTTEIKYFNILLITPQMLWACILWAQEFSLKCGVPTLHSAAHPN